MQQKRCGSGSPQNSNLLRETIMKGGAESRKLVENIQVDRRIQAIRLYSEQPTTWKAKEMKSPTKKDFFKLMKAINTRKYEDPKPKKKPGMTLKDSFGSILKNHLNLS